MAPKFAVRVAVDDGCGTQVVENSLTPKGYTVSPLIQTEIQEIVSCLDCEQRN